MPAVDGLEILCQPVEVGRSSQYLWWVLYIPGERLISEPLTII